MEEIIAAVIAVAVSVIGAGGKTYVNRDVRVKDLQLLGGRQDSAPAQGKDDCPFDR